MAAALMVLELPGLRPLVVDDNRPDGSGDVAEALAARFNEPGRPRISVLLRTTEDGLGRSWGKPHSRCGSGAIRW
ncbi:hypothetical protein ACFVY1_34930 [Streptomyces sp. NPDC058293]|uniref:hypothetical protein n=1 Tax=Streptomyces sp. NPDC058293 TaxID=3346429 RepID=UPI0036EA3334